MFLETIPLESPEAAPLESQRLNVCKIILMEMERRNIRAISLRHTPGIKHKTVKKRLQSGDVCDEERSLLIQHLRLNPERISYTVAFLGKAEDYFSDHCTFMMGITASLDTVMRETLPALGGDFIPIKGHLYDAIARKVQILIVEQHKRDLARFAQDQPLAE